MLLRTLYKTVNTRPRLNSEVSVEEQSAASLVTLSLEEPDLLKLGQPNQLPPQEVAQ